MMNVSINGLSVRNLSSFKDHEGLDIYQGDLFLNGEKIGFWSQDAWGGPDIFQFIKGVDYELLNEKVKELNKENELTCDDVNGKFTISFNLDILMYEYIKLTKYREGFEGSKQAGGKGLMLITDGTHTASWTLNESASKLSDAELQKMFLTEIEEAKKSSGFFPETQFTKHEFKAFRSEKDFEVGEAIQMKEIVKQSSIEEKMRRAEQTGIEKVLPVGEEGRPENKDEITR